LAIFFFSIVISIGFSSSLNFNYYSDKELQKTQRSSSYQMNVALGYF